MDHRGKSWWYLFSTLVLAIVCLMVCLCPIHWVPRFIVSSLAGLFIIRFFIIYHDFQHNAILTHSKLAAGIMKVYGMLVLSPESVWNRSHDHHHQHNCKDNGEHIGSFPVMTCKEYAESTYWERSRYALSRHPLTIALGYLTIFMGGMCIRSVLINPRRHMDSAIALLLHLALALTLLQLGWEYLFFCLVLPLTIACGMGSYLFYAQHNFPGCKLSQREDWSYVRAALYSSSYMKMNPLMQWFTGNIGFHHIHHLNAKIPFYRLPEAMKGLHELQSPIATSLRFRDMYACLRLKLWDSEQERFVSFSEARRT